MCGWQHQITCSLLRAACGRVAEPCSGGLSAVVPNQSHGLLHAGRCVQPPRVGLVKKRHGCCGHWNYEFWQVMSGKLEKKRHINTLWWINSMHDLLSFQGDSHGFVWRLRTAQHICRGSAGAPVRNNRFTVLPKAFSFTQHYRSGEVGEDYGRGLLRLLLFLFFLLLQQFTSIYSEIRFASLYQPS